MVEMKNHKIGKKVIGQYSRISAISAPKMPLTLTLTLIFFGIAP
jgi:hypothetical protein